MHKSLRRQVKVWCQEVGEILQYKILKKAITNAKDYCPLKQSKIQLGCLVLPETRKPLNTHHMSGPYTLRFFYENSGKKVQNCLHQTLHVPNYKMLALYYDGVMCNSMPLSNRKRVYDFSKRKKFLK